MKKETMAATCAQCGAEIASGLLDDRCPKCLLWLAIEDEPGEAAAISGGRKLTGYELLEEIGRGGMGAVYKARQISLNRVVAVKMILAGGLASEEAVRRFRAEAAMAASLQHPHIVAVHEVGEFEGHQYFSMDYVEGKNLAELARDHPLAVRQAAGYLKTIAEAVQYAHQQGILHRDLKPSNVLIDLFDQPRITDFGLAKRLWVAGIPPGGSGGGIERGQAGPLNSQTGNLIKPEWDFTLSGQVLGSPNFMPPEQAAGRPGDMGPASDVYGMGALLYYLLTGRPPFQAESLTSLLKQVAGAEPVTPRLLNPNVPKDLETICLRCMEKEPIRRYRSAQLLAAELGRFLAGEPILARPVGALSKGWRWCRRQPAVAALSAGLVLSVGLGFAGVVWQWRLARMEAYRSQRYAYGASMNLAQQALEENNLRRVVELLSLQQPQPGASDVRGWEWRYLWNQCQGDQILSLDGHSNTVTSVDYLPDGHGLISASCDRTIRFWNAQTGVQTDWSPGLDINHRCDRTDGGICGNSPGGGEKNRLHLAVHFHWVAGWGNDGHRWRQDVCHRRRLSVPRGRHGPTRLRPGHGPIQRGIRSSELTGSALGIDPH